MACYACVFVFVLYLYLSKCVFLAVCTVVSNDLQGARSKEEGGAIRLWQASSYLVLVFCIFDINIMNCDEVWAIPKHPYNMPYNILIE